MRDKNKKNSATAKMIQSQVQIFSSNSISVSPRSIRHLHKKLLKKRLNFVRMWCKTHVLTLKSQYDTSFYHIFKNKHNHI